MSRKESHAVMEQPPPIPTRANAETGNATVPPSYEQQAPSAGPPAPPPAAPQAAAFPPPALGKTPTSIGQLAPKPPIGAKATHFSAPISSGPTPGSAAVAGAAVLTLTLTLDYSMGNFSLPIQFPVDSLLLWAALVESATAFTAPPSVSVGMTNGAADIVAATPLAGAGKTAWVAATGQLPLEGAVSPQVPFQGWINVTANGANTAGFGYVVLGYARIPQPWN